MANCVFWPSVDQISDSASWDLTCCFPSCDAGSSATAPCLGRRGGWPGRSDRLLGDQCFEEASGVDHPLPHVLGTARLVGRRVHAAVALDVVGVVDGEGGDLVLEPLAVGEAAVLCQAGQEGVRLGDA